MYIGSEYVVYPSESFSLHCEENKSETRRAHIYFKSLTPLTLTRFKLYIL